MSINRCAGCGQRLEARRRRASSPAAAPAPPAQAGDMLAGAGRNTEVSPSMLLLGHLSSGALQLETESWRAGNPPCRRRALATRSGDHQAAGHGSLHAARGPLAEYEPRVQSHIIPSRRPNMVPAAAVRCTGRRRRTGRRHTDAGGTHSKGRCGRAFHDTTIVYAIQSEAELQLHGPQRASPCSPGQRSPPDSQSGADRRAQCDAGALIGPALPLATQRLPPLPPPLPSLPPPPPPLPLPALMHTHLPSQAHLKPDIQQHAMAPWAARLPPLQTLRARVEGGVLWLQVSWLGGGSLGARHPPTASGVICQLTRTSSCP